MAEASETVITSQDAGTSAGTVTRKTVSHIAERAIRPIRQITARLEIETKPEGTLPTFDLFLQRATKPDPGAGDWQDLYHFPTVTDLAATDVEMVLHTELGVIDDMLAISDDRIHGVTHVNKFGRNVDTDQKGTTTIVVHGRDIWDGGIDGASRWLPPTTARTHQIVSSNDEDGGAGTDTGALTLRIFGLDADYALQQEDITLNGTTNVPTANTYTMIHRMKALTFGVPADGRGPRNLGNITATADTDGTVTAKITADNNQSLMAIYQIPANTRGYVTHWGSELRKAGGGATFADVFLLSMEFGGAWRVRDSEALATDGANTADRKFEPYEKLEPKEYVKIVADPSKDAQDVGGNFDIILMRPSAFSAEDLQQEGLAEGHRRDGHWGDLMRVREVVGGSALSQGCVYSLHLTGY